MEHITVISGASCIFFYISRRLSGLVTAIVLYYRYNGENRGLGTGWHQTRIDIYSFEHLAQHQKVIDMDLYEPYFVCSPLLTIIILSSSGGYSIHQPFFKVIWQSSSVTDFHTQLIGKLHRRISYVSPRPNDAKSWQLGIITKGFSSISYCKLICLLLLQSRYLDSADALSRWSLGRQCNAVIFRSNELVLESKSFLGNPNSSYLAESIPCI